MTGNSLSIPKIKSFNLTGINSANDPGKSRNLSPLTPVGTVSTKESDDGQPNSGAKLIKINEFCTNDQSMKLETELKQLRSQLKTKDDLLKIRDDKIADLESELERTRANEGNVDKLMKDLEASKTEISKQDLEIQ